MKILIAVLALIVGGTFALRPSSASAMFSRESATVRETQTPTAGAATMIPVSNVKTCLWFANEAEEAARFYTSIFAGSKVLRELRWGDEGFGPPGAVIAVELELAGRPFMTLNGAQGVTFNDTVSIVIECESQAEIDALWEKLTAGGKPGQCGWLKDKFGVSWQVVPKELITLLSEKDPVKRKRVLETMNGMSKLDVGRLKQARDGR